MSEYEMRTVGHLRGLYTEAELAEAQAIERQEAEPEPALVSMCVVLGECVELPDRRV